MESQYGYIKSRRVTFGSILEIYHNKLMSKRYSFFVLLLFIGCLVVDCKMKQVGHIYAYIIVWQGLVVRVCCSSGILRRLGGLKVRACVQSITDLLHSPTQIN